VKEVPHKRSPEEQVASPDRIRLNQAKWAAHDAFLAARHAFNLLDKDADPALARAIQSSKEHAWKLYDVLARETER
jgi:hypothetical protein